jgi:hypothetical protein
MAALGQVTAVTDQIPEIFRTSKSDQSDQDVKTEGWYRARHLEMAEDQLRLMTEGLQLQRDSLERQRRSQEAYERVVDRALGFYERIAVALEKLAPSAALPSPSSEETLLDRVRDVFDRLDDGARLSADGDVVRFQCDVTHVETREVVEALKEAGLEALAFESDHDTIWGQVRGSEGE